MEQLEKYLKDLKAMIDIFREEVDALADELSTDGARMTPEELYAKLFQLQERHRQAANEKYAEVLQEAAIIESDLRTKLQEVRIIKEQAERTGSILRGLTEGTVAPT